MPLSRQSPTGPAAESAAYFITGLVSVLMGYSIYSHLKTASDRIHQSPKRSDNRSERKLEDDLQLRSLAYLTQSHNVNIQHSSTKIILDRAMSAAYLPKIIAACDKSQPITSRVKALPCLQLLTRKDSNKAALLQAGALNILVDALKCTDPKMKDCVKRHVAVAICDLIQGNDANKNCILDLGVLEPIKTILTADNIRNNELKYWTLMILYHLSLTDPPSQKLAKDGFVGLLARMARMTYGNTNMPKFCMRSLVRITANIHDPQEARLTLRQLLQYNIVDLIVSCLRQSEDAELIFWAAGLMHELVLKDVAAEQFRAVKGIHTILSTLLSVEEMYISRVILRTIRFLAFDDGDGQDDEFKQEMVKSGMVKKIMQCLSVENEDVQYWATLCIHVVAGEVKSHAEIVTAPEFEVLLDLAVSKKLKVAIFVSDILSLICCISSNNDFMTPKINEIVRTLNTLLVDGEVDVQYNAAGAIFNVMAMTSIFANKVRDVCFDSLVNLSTSATHERVQLTCTKGVLMVAIKNRFLISQVNQQVTEPLMNSVSNTLEAVLPVLIVQSLIRSRTAAQLEANNRNEADNSTHTTDEETKDVTAEDILRRLFHTDNDNADSKQREELWAKYELPLTIKQQLMGALSSLSILLENDRILQNVLTGEQQHAYKYSMLDVADNITMNVDDISPSIYDQKSNASYNNDSNGFVNELRSEMQQQRPSLARDSTFSPSSSVSLFSSTATTSALSALRTEKLTENRRLIDQLVSLSLYPVLKEWTLLNNEKYPFNTITKDKVIASTVYQDCIVWIKSYVELPKSGVNRNGQYDKGSGELAQQMEEVKRALLYKRCGSNSTNNTSNTSFKRQQSQQRENFPNVVDELITIHTDADSESSGKDSSDSSSSSSSNSNVSLEGSTGGNFYTQQNSQIEQQHRQLEQPATINGNLQSAAERLGETRRTEELTDLSDLLSVSLGASLSSSAAASTHLASKESQYFLLAHRALSLLTSMMRNSSVREYLLYEAGFLHVLVYLLEHCLKNDDDNYNNKPNRQRFNQHQTTTATTERVLACLASILIYEKQPPLCSTTTTTAVLQDDTVYRSLPKELLQHLAILTWQNVYHLRDLLSSPPTTIAALPMAKKRKKHIIAQLFYSRQILSFCRVTSSLAPFDNGMVSGNDNSHSVQSTMNSKSSVVKIDGRIRSKYCLVDQESHLRVRNDTWTFETVRATHCVPSLHDQQRHHHRISSSQQQQQTYKYAFEVVLETDGLMQIGWVTDHFQFDPEGGKGVGDDIHSYGYDGHRCKKWHRRTYEHHHHHSQNAGFEEETDDEQQHRKVTASYGLKWAEGDVITCAIDMEKGELRYFTNGDDMGVAFRGAVITTRAWYPAISLATGQQCRFQFGDEANPLQYLPEGYVPMAALAADEYLNDDGKKPSNNGLHDSNNEEEEEDSIELQPFLFESSDEVDLLDSNAMNDANNTVEEQEKKEVEDNTSSAHFPDTDEKSDLVILNCIYENVQNFVNPAISLYYEVTFGKMNSERMIKLGFYSLDSRRSIYFDYYPKMKRFALRHANKSMTYVSVSINEGDTIGVVYIEQLGRIGLIKKGELGVFVELKENAPSKHSPLYLPLVDVPQQQAFNINYGEDLFCWRLANSKATRNYMTYYLLNRL